MTEVLVRLGVCQSSLIVVRPRVGFGLLHKNHNNCSSIIHCSTRLSKLPSSWGFGVSWDLQRQCLLTAGAVSSDPLKSSTVLTFDSIQPDMSTGGGDGDGFGDNGGGGGGGGGDNNKGDDEGGSDENSKKTASMSMSQKLTLAYAALVGVGGVMGYLKSGSQKSLLAGALSASLLCYVYAQLPARPILASSVGLGLSAALLGVMGSRFKKSGKIFPAGVVSLVSLIMSGGYLHGIMRSLH
ncbi:protein FATTY ACID EXPORT 2, chloroplastic-like [Fagus crenata]